MQTGSRVAANTGILYIRMAITVFISLYATRLTLQALGVLDFGLFSLVGGVIAMLGFLNGSMAAATQRFMSFAQGGGDYASLKRIFNMSIVLHAAIAVSVIIIFEIISFFLFKGILNIPRDRVEIAKLVYQFMVISTFFTIISVPFEAMITAHENMLFYAIEGVAEAVLKLAIAFYINYTKNDPLLIYGLLTAVSSVFLLLLRQVYCYNKYPECRINVRCHFDKLLLKKMTSFAGWSLMGSSTGVIANYGQGIVVNMFFGTAVNAAQGIAGQVSGQLGAFATTLMKALNPLIAKSEGAGNRGLMLKATMIGSKVSFFLLILFYVPILIEMPYIFKLWLSEVPEYVVVFCKLLLMRCLIDQMFVPLTASIAAVGNIKNFQMFTSILNFIPLVVSFLLFDAGAPPFTLYVVFIVYSLISSGLILHFARIHCNISVFFFLTNIVMRCIVSFMLIYVLSTIPIFFINPGLSRLTIVLVLHIFSFSLITWVVGFMPEEKEEVLTIKNRIVSILKDKLVK